MENKIDLWSKVPGSFMPYLEPVLLSGCTKPLGCVLVLPGGGYTHRADHEGRVVAERFNAMGFHAAVLQYRIEPDYYPQPQQDALRAIRIIRSHAVEWKINPDQIAILGFSAGGHLAASAGVWHDRIDCNAGDAADNFSCRPDALILCYSVIALTGYGHQGCGYALYGADASEETRRSGSLAQYVTVNTPPAFLWHNATDTCVPVHNSVAFAEAMWSAGAEAELHIFPSGPHGGGIRPERPESARWPEMAGHFLAATRHFTTETK